MLVGMVGVGMLKVQATGGEAWTPAVTGTEDDATFYHGVRRRVPGRTHCSLHRPAGVRVP